MESSIASLIVAALGLFSLALMAVSIRASRAAHVQPSRAPSRRTQAQAVSESLFRNRS